MPEKVPPQNTPATASKSKVACPHCGASQEESRFAQSTICRTCGQYFSLAKPAAPAPPPRPARWEAWLSALPPFLRPRPRERTITCLHCGHRQRVSTSAKSSHCPGCSGYIDLENHKITGTFSRNIVTHGRVTVTPRGELSGISVLCGDALIAGKLRANLRCSGTLRMKSSGLIPGKIEAGLLLIEKKQRVRFALPVRGRDVQVLGALEADIIADGTVSVGKRGHLTGEVRARGFQVEKGGEFHGRLTIGPPPATKAAPAPAASVQPELPLSADSGFRPSPSSA